MKQNEDKTKPERNKTPERNKKVTDENINAVKIVNEIKEKKKEEKKKKQ